MKKSLLILFTVVMVFGVFVSTGCQNVELKDNSGNDSVDSDVNLTYITNLRINIMESHPLQASVTVKGYMPNPCHDLLKDQIEIERENNVFFIKIYQRNNQKDDMVCATVIVPFEVNISLDILNLKAGRYDVFVNESEISFELEQDNSFSNIR